MKPLSIAVDTAWRLAVWEASASNSEFIEKEHDKAAANKWIATVDNNSIVIERQEC
ncbi:MAG: hypothetical protein WCP20_15915 [Desulfuromonadales bacterium]